MTTASELQTPLYASPNVGAGASRAATAPKLKDVLRSQSMSATGIGNMLEWFDWAIYGVFAPYIAKALFNPADPASALLSTLAVFAVGFVFRPLGGLVMGNLADRVGRKSILLATMLLMSAASLMIGLAPTYATAGGWASAVILCARLLQGFAHGGESTASYAYLAEIAPPNKRALWSSSMFFSVGLGVLFATLLGSFLTHTLDPVAMAEWGWRTPFLAGAALSLVVLYLRRHMVESEVYEEGQENDIRHVNTDAIAVWSRRKIVLRALGIFAYQAGTTLPYYIWSSFVAVFAISQRGMAPSGAFTASVGAQILNIILVPVMGYVSDRIGRKRVTVFYYLATAALTAPLLNYINSDPWSLFLAQGIMLSISACIGGTQPAIVAERVPTRYRARIMGTAMPLSVALFGGTAPYLTSWCYAHEAAWAFNAYVIVICLISAAVVSTWKETKGIALRDVT